MHLSVRVDVEVSVEFHLQAHSALLFETPDLAISARLANLDWLGCLQPRYWAGRLSGFLHRSGYKTPILILP